MSEPGSSELSGFEVIDNVKAAAKTKTIKVETLKEETLHQDQHQLQQPEYMSKFAGQTVGVSKSRSLYALTEDVKRDKVSLGKKTWKPKGEQVRRNQAIDEGKALTKDATEDTVAIYKAFQKVRDTQHSDFGNLSQDRRTNQSFFGILLNVNFTPKMITRSYIKNNFDRVYNIVYAYTILNSRRDQLEPGDIEFLERLAPKMDILSRRLHNYAEKNHVSLMGKAGKDFKSSHIISDKEMEGHDYAKFSDEDMREWFSLTSAEKEDRKRERKRVALEPAQLTMEELDEATTGIVDLDQMYEGDSQQLLNMTKEERIRTIPAMAQRINFLQEKIRENKPEDAGNQLGYRKELAELTTVHKLATLQAALSKLLLVNGRDQKLADKVFEVSEEVRALKKRLNMREDHQPEVTTPAGIVSLTREEALSTDSDKASFEARAKLYERSRSIPLADDGPLALFNVPIGAVKEAALKYYETSHYSAGYKAEVKAMKDLKDKLSKLPPEAFTQIPQLAEFKTLVESQTNGDLVIEQDVHDPLFIDASKERPKDDAGEDGAVFKKSVDIREDAMNNFLTRSWEDKSDEPLFAHEPTVNDLRQGKVSNCWMVSGTTAALNYDPSIIKKCMKDNGNGTVTVRLYDRADIEDEHYVRQVCARPVYITVKKEVPRLVTGGAIQSSGALWMQMLEKAAAFLGREDGRKGYKSLWYGTGQEWFFTLTGHAGTIIAGASDVVANNELGVNTLKDTKGSDRIFEDIMHAKENGYVYHYGSKDKTSAGMNSGHAYTVLGGRVINGERYVLLRNPYANMTLKYGADGTQHMTENFMSSEMNETCGQFLIKLDDFFANMKELARTDVKKPIRYEDEAMAAYRRRRDEEKARAEAKAKEPLSEEEEAVRKARMEEEMKAFLED